MRINHLVVVVTLAVVMIGGSDAYAQTGTTGSSTTSTTSSTSTTTTAPSNCAPNSPSCEGQVTTSSTTSTTAPSQPVATPSFTVSPQSGPVGTLVHFQGDIDPSQIDAYRNTAGQGLWGASSPTCAILVPFEQFHINVDDNGHATGSFVVGNTVFGCNMNAAETPPTTPPPGIYAVTLSAHCCPEAQFRITSVRALARTGAALWQPLFVGIITLLAGGEMLLASRRRQSRS